MCFLVPPLCSTHAFQIPAAASLIQSLWKCYAADKNFHSKATWRIHLKEPVQGGASNAWKEVLQVHCTPDIGYKVAREEIAPKKCCWCCPKNTQQTLHAQAPSSFLWLCTQKANHKNLRVCVLRT